MQEQNPANIVSKGLDGLDLSLNQPPDPRTLDTPNKRKEAYIRWGITYYAYSVIAHIRTALRGLTILSENNNIPTAIVVCRHVFEWTSQVCFMNENLRQQVSSKDWDAARDLLDQAVMGSRWIKEFGHKYDATIITTEVPNSIRLKDALASYEAHVKKFRGGETKDDYAYLSEHSHPNSACFRQYLDDVLGGDIRFKEPTTGSPLPVVNWCLIDLSMLLLELLGLGSENPVRSQLAAILKEIAGLPYGKKQR